MMNNNSYLYGALIICFVLITACSSPADSGEELTNTDLLQGTWVVQNATVDGEEQPITNPGLGQVEVSFEGEQFKYTFPEIGSNGLPTGDAGFIEGTWSFNDAEDTLLIDRSAYGANALTWKIVNLSTGNLEIENVEYFPGREEPSVFRFLYRLK